MKYAVLGLSAAALVGGVAFYLTQTSAPQFAAGELYSDEQMIKVAKIFQKEFFPAYEIAASMSRQMLAMIAMQSGRSPAQLPQGAKDQIREQAISQSTFIAINPP